MAIVSSLNRRTLIKGIALGSALAIAPRRARAGSMDQSGSARWCL